MGDAHMSSREASFNLDMQAFYSAFLQVRVHTLMCTVCALPVSCVCLLWCEHCVCCVCVYVQCVLALCDLLVLWVCVVGAVCCKRAWVRELF
jgi:hypothetical protein